MTMGIYERLFFTLLPIAAIMIIGAACGFVIMPCWAFAFRGDGR